MIGDGPKRDCGIIISRRCRSVFERPFSLLWVGNVPKYVQKSAKPLPSCEDRVDVVSAPCWIPYGRSVVIELRNIYSFCAASIVKEIETIYPIPGHSMMPIDRCFALTEKNRLQHEKVNTPKYYVKLIASARIKKPFDIVFLEHTLFTPGKDIAEEIPVLRVLDFKKMKSSIPGISKSRSSAEKPKGDDGLESDAEDYESLVFCLYELTNKEELVDEFNKAKGQLVLITETKLKDKGFKIVKDGHGLFYLVAEKHSLSSWGSLFGSQSEFE
ncbi:hypothetical protein ILUMI_19074 [Ignelater luminosus]|uniref:Uncharacterized protein n=1 Tax=Ignelater luminosus TaxID=2038154 RepID=A0A8K0G5T2_IGNLU|nr:hypothetical protein ILUMI_19074 [Ignelater luminosus]